MVDVFSPEERSAIMARIKSRNTKPEILVRKVVHSLGYRFRLHRDNLPGKPDIVLPRRSKVIFVHGCFWHGHSRCARATMPSTNVTFWKEKIANNKARDRKVLRQLRNSGWKVLIIWQCQIIDISNLKQQLSSFLSE
jgi:DNA mismatch endonuclease (patch repair protein)